MLLNWIKPKTDFGEVCPIFRKDFKVDKKVKSVFLEITAAGVYEASLNNKKIGDGILTPGWTSYSKRHMYQTYDITEMVSENNILTVNVGKGWYRSSMDGGCFDARGFLNCPPAIIACIEITYNNGTTEVIHTDDTWKVSKSEIIFSTIYDGEIFDATAEKNEYGETEIMKDFPKDNLIPQEGRYVKENYKIKPLEYIITPKGERVIDFGRNMAGYVEFAVNANRGDRILISYAEILDSDGNFYTDNYRKAKSLTEYICTDGYQKYKPHHTFFGFRYIRLDEFPEDFDLYYFTAITINTEMERTGYFKCSDELLNKMYENIISSQQSNFIDIPADCPQRDERLGWTGDAQVFTKTAAYNFNIKEFFEKWLNDMMAEQWENGYVPYVIPNSLPIEYPASAGYEDAAVICPWQIYLFYGDKKLLSKHYPMMRKWIKYITESTTEKYLWTGGEHFGDWLDLEAAEGSYKGASDKDLIATAFYAYSTSLVIKAGKELGEDVSYYENLYENIKKAFKKRFTKLKTQTEHILVLYFGLTDEPEKIAKSLANLIKECGGYMKTGFLGTPYILHALSDNGYEKLAYNLLLRREFPSWLYPVTKGATTIWEHLDGIKPDGTLWDRAMNSFNHYSYGSVGEWLYDTAAGIKTSEKFPGFEKIIFEPITDPRLSWLEASVKTKNGTASIRWEYCGETVKYTISTPADSEIFIGGKKYSVGKGNYIFYN